MQSEAERIAKSLTIERYDKDASRIMRNGEVVGMILRHCDDRWSLNDRDEKRVIGMRFSSANAAFRFARDNLPDQFTILQRFPATESRGTPEV